MGLLFIIGGLFSLGVAALIYTVHQAFFSAGSRNILGKVVEIIVFDQTSKDALGRVNDVTERQEPVVEFCHAGKTYRFQANIDILANSLSVGSNVSVVINEKKYPGVAKLLEETSSYQSIMMIFAILGVVFLLVGVFVFDFRALISMLTSPFFWVWLLGGGVFLFLTGRRVLLMARDFPLFPENITEVEEK